jgi:hypothetical protein
MPFFPFPDPCLMRAGQIGHGNGECDYDDLPAELPAWKTSLDVDHSGTHGEASGGALGRAPWRIFK